MKYPIPDDWDGITWQCYQIQFPSSLRWDAILNGWLSSLFKGRVWDETTGSIIDVQAIMREMWDRNHALTACEETYPADYYADDCEDEMSCNCPEPPIKIEDGKLYFWHCCEWVEIGELPGAYSPVTEPYADEDPQPTFSACSKAQAIVDVIYKVGDIVWENQDTFPWTWVGLVEDEIIGHNDLDDNQIISAFGTAIVLNVSFDYSDIFDPYDKQDLISKIEKILASDSAGITRTQWDQMIGIITSVYGVAIGAFWRACAEAIGPGDMREITALMAKEAGYDCSAPAAAIEDPTGDWGTTWAYFKDLTRDKGLTVTPNTSDWEALKGWFKTDAESGYQDIQVNIPFATAQDASYITRAWVRLRLPASMSYINTETTLLRTFGSQVIMDQADVADTDPSMGGIIIMSDFAVNVQCNAATSPMKFRLEGDVANPANEVAYLEAIAFGGSGVSPFI